MKKILYLVVLMVFFTSGISLAQINIDLKGKIRDRINNRLNNATDNALDSVENGITKPKKNKKPVKNQDNQTEESSNTNVDNNSDNQLNNNQNNQNVTPSLQSYSKFDFIPGEKVIFFEDFASDNIGDFPASWNTTGSGEVTTTNLFTGKWFYMKPNAYFMPEVKIGYPENFTLEFDLIMGLKPEESVNDGLSIYFFKESEDWKISDAVSSPRTQINLTAGSANASSSKPGGNEFFTSDGMTCEILERDKKFSQSVHVSIWIQKQRSRLYVENQKILDLPKCITPNAGYDRLLFETFGSAEVSIHITNIRIAQGLPDMRSKIFTDGKIVSYGILFDSGKDVVKPESYGTLKEIAQLLKDNATLKLKIVGHTDADGNAASNLDLSKRRSVSIKNVLVKEFQIDTNRLETDGLGQSQPVAKNDTPANKALNRRVEFIKL